MPDRWSIVVQDGAASVQRNGAWYSDEDTVDDAVALVSNRRGKQVVIVHEDGYQETRRL